MKNDKLLKVGVIGGLIKLVADKTSKTILGAHILTPEGADSIQTAAMAIKVGMTYDELSTMIFPYLTTVEGLKLAAQTFEKDVATLSCCAGEPNDRKIHDRKFKNWK